MNIKRNLISVMAAFALTWAAFPAFASNQLSWEILRTERNDTKQIVKEQELEIRSAKGAIIVTTSRPVQIKVFTILGQIVSNETVPAGTSQLSVAGHGIYIVKVGSLTCKVAL